VSHQRRGLHRRDGARSDEEVEQSCLFPRWRGREAGVPLIEQLAHLTAKRDEIASARFEFREPLSHECSHAATRDAAPLPFAERARQLIERETHPQGTLDQLDPDGRLGGIPPIAVRQTSWSGQHTLSFVMPERIRAHAGQARKLRRAERCATIG
jgi:hypothetical protein